ncbi:hypothetical protein RUND412_009160 [Rhizina undulata]
MASYAIIEPPRPPPYRKPPPSEKRPATSHIEPALKRPRLEFNSEFPTAARRNPIAKRKERDRVEATKAKERPVERRNVTGPGSSREDAMLIDDEPCESAEKLWSAPDPPKGTVVIRESVVTGSDETWRVTTKEQELRQGFAAYVCPVCCRQLYQLIVSAGKGFTMCTDKECPYPFNLPTEEMKQHFTIRPKILFPNTEGIKLPPSTADLSSSLQHPPPRPP